MTFRSRYRIKVEILEDDVYSSISLLFFFWKRRNLFLFWWRRPNRLGEKERKEDNNDSMDENENSFLTKRPSASKRIKWSIDQSINSKKKKRDPILRAEISVVDEEERNEGRRCSRLKRRGGGRGGNTKRWAKSSSVEFNVLFIVTWIRTMKSMRSGSVDPPLDLRSFSVLRTL